MFRPSLLALDKSKRSRAFHHDFIPSPLEQNCLQLIPRKHLQYGTCQAACLPPVPSVVQGPCCSGEEEPRRCSYHYGYTFPSMQGQKRRIQGHKVPLVVSSGMYAELILLFRSDELLTEIFKVFPMSYTVQPILNHTTPACHCAVYGRPCVGRGHHSWDGS